MANEGNEQRTEDAEELAAAIEPDAPLYVNDWFLQELIELAEMGLEQWVTLTIGGSHICGRLISGQKFFEQLAYQMDAAKTVGSTEELQKTLVNLYKSHADIYSKSSEDRPPFGTSRPNYIHLRDARWHSLEGNILPGNGTFWRGKLSAVDGFMFGELKIEHN
jgi:hypothetical protein